jgi:hypothetical protein
MGLRVEGDGLVARVKAGHIALSAVDAKIVVDYGELLLLRHVVDVLEVVVACASDILQSWHLGDLHFSWLLSLSPEIEVVYEFL